MKNILPLIFTLGLLISCTAQHHDRNDLNEYNLKGSVRKLKEIAYEGVKKDGIYELGDHKEHVNLLLTFNEHGNVVEYISLDETGSATWIKKHHYNEDQLRTLIETFQDGELKSKEVSIIDNNKVIGSKYYNKKGKNTETYHYTYKGNRVNGYVLRDHKEKVLAKGEMMFKNGVLIKQRFTDGDGNLDYEIAFKKNDNNDIIELALTTDKEPKKIIRSKFEYDAQDNWVRRIDFDEASDVDQIVIREITYFSDKTK